MNENIKNEEFLFELYKLRCLSLKTIHEFFYPEKDFISKKINPMLKQKLIHAKKIDENWYVEITQKGLDYVREKSDIPNEIYNIERNRYEKSFLKLSDILIEDKYVKHQDALNQFVLAYKGQYPDMEYYDEKFISGLTTILRPDGMIRLDNADLYLEQDMGTESAKQLRDKWYRYRRYLSTAYSGNRKIIVLFIVKCQNAEARNLLVRKTILESFDQLMSNNFEIYIGTKEELLNACRNRILVGDKTRTIELFNLLKRHRYEIYDGSKMKVKLGGVIYKYYTRKIKDKRVEYYCPNRNRMGRFQEFFVDNYDYSPMTVLSKIKFHQKNSKNFDIAYSNKANARLIGYIVLTRNPKKLYSHMKACGLLKQDNVFITTPARLKRTVSFPRALLHFNENGEVFSCQDGYFIPVKKECDINDLGIDGFSKTGQ